MNSKTASKARIYLYDEENIIKKITYIYDDGSESKPLPWTTFEGFHLNLQKGYDYLLPIFTLGKYYEESGKIILPLAIQVHHAICDGFHVCRFINELQELVNN